MLFRKSFSQLPLGIIQVYNWLPAGLIEAVAIKGQFLKRMAQLNDTILT